MKRKTILVLSSLMLLSSFTNLANHLPSSHKGISVTDKIVGQVADYVAPKKVEGVGEVVGSDYVSGVATQVKEESDGTYSLRFVSLIKGTYNSDDELELIGDYGFHLEFEGSQGLYNSDYDVTYLYNSISETIGENSKYYANERSSYHGQEGVESLSSLPVIGSEDYNLVMAVTIEGISSDKLDTIFTVQSYVRVNDVKYYNSPSSKRVSVNNPSGTWNVITDSNGGVDVPDSTYTSGTLTLTNPTRDNFVFTGWYYDKDCKNPVDLENPIIAGDTTLYAGWRAPYAYIEETDVAGVYRPTTKNTAALHGIAEAEGYAIEMPMKFIKGDGGAIGIAFRGTFVDYSIETGQKYLTVQLGPAKGGLQIAHIDNGFAHIDTSKTNITTLPQSWQDKFNGASEGEEISVTLKVVTSPDSFVVYIDGELAYTSRSKDAELIASYTGKGYGLRTSSKAEGTCYSVNYSEDDLVKVSLDDGENVINRYTTVGGKITLDNPSVETLPNGNKKTVDEVWLNGSIEAKADDTYSTDTTLTLKSRDVKITRAGLVVTSDENGEVYTDYASDNYSAATLLPDVSMASGTFSYDVEYTKQDGVTMNHRLLFLAKGNGTDVYNADSDEGSLFFNINFGTGTAVVGYKIHNVSQNGNNAGFKTGLKSCSLKTKLYGTDTSDPNYVANGDRVKINMKVTFDETGVKVYMDNFLVYVLGSISYEGETLYGKAYSTGATGASNLPSADQEKYGTTIGAVCLSWLKQPEGLGVGFQATFTSMTSAKCGDVIISNVKTDSTI